MAIPVTVDQRTRRSDDDALQGHAVKVIDGPHAGQVGSFLYPALHDPKTGYPVEIVVRFRNSAYTHELAIVPYKSVRPAEHPGHQ